jgi:hypothetical protein
MIVKLKDKRVHNYMIVYEMKNHLRIRAERVRSAFELQFSRIQNNFFCVLHNLEATTGWKDKNIKIKSQSNSK